MRNEQQILQLLDQLTENIADDLESQDLDFKRWPIHIKEAVDQVVSMAVCMANGNGGTVVFGVADRVKGRENAILGVPADVDVNLFVARQRRHHGEKGLSNAEVRAITQYDRNQAKRLLSQLADEGVMELLKRGRWSEWIAK